MVLELPLARGLSPSRLKVAASVLVALPAAVLLLFAVGEMANGDLSGSQHLVEAAPLLVLLAVGWRAPRIAGWVLLVVAALLFIVWIVFVIAEGEPSPRGWAILMWVAAGLLLFTPPLLAGYLFLQAGRHA